MSQYFSVVDVGGTEYYMAGRVTEDDLQDFEPLVQFLFMFREDEDVYFWVTPGLYISGDSAPDIDMPAETLDNFTELLPALEEAGLIIYADPVRFEVKGALDKPYEDYFELEGEEREAWQVLKTQWLIAEQEYVKVQQEQGIDEEDIKNSYSLLYTQLYAEYLDEVLYGTEDEETEGDADEENVVEEVSAPPTAGRSIYSSAADDDLVLPGE